MGVINATPDSFSDGGSLYRSGGLDLDLAMGRARDMVAAGAAILDIGGESTRPGAAPVSPAQEMDRVLPLVERVAAELDVVISVDTSTPQLMTEAASLGAGLLLGRKAYKEDMENRMMRVRNEAKTNLRRFIDDVLFVVTKESRDRLKNVQRQLRDHYREIANQTTRSLNESLQSTIAAARMEETERNNRIRELERQHNILTQVLDNADKLLIPSAQREGRPGA